MRLFSWKSKVIKLCEEYIFVPGIVQNSKRGKKTTKQQAHTNQDQLKIQLILKDVFFLQNIFWSDQEWLKQHKTIVLRQASEINLFTRLTIYNTVLWPRLLISN